jgi:hypothetical protein
VATAAYSDLAFWLKSHHLVKVVELLCIMASPTVDALPSHGGETQVRVSQSQVAELGLGSTLSASNSRKG